MRPLRVLVVHPGAELYGSDRMLVESVRGLVDVGATVDVVLPEEGPLVAEVAAAGARCLTMAMPILRKAALRPRGMLDLLTTAVRVIPRAHRLLRSAHPDVVYVSTQVLPFWLLVARSHRIATVCHVHEAERHPSRVVELGLVLPLRAADRILVNSAYSASVLSDVLPSLRKRTQIVYNGVAGPATAVAPRPDLDSPVQILFLGRLSPRKGPDVAMEAVRRLHDEGLDVRLTVLGSVFSGYEWFEEELRARYAREISAGSIVLRGFVADVWQALAEADVVVVPSTVPEPFGNTAVEARLAGRPVVVSDIGGLPETLTGGSATVVVPAGDPDALAEAVRGVVHDWSQTAAAATGPGRADALARFSPERYRREVAVAVTTAAGAPSPAMVP